MSEAENNLSAFERLHPAIQHHIVNSLGWSELRPFQESVIPQILDRKHMIVLAPTAGGKTEAAFFPIASRMLTEDWRGLSVLYICPIKALLNNLDVRLQRYFNLVGRRSAVWHGDIKQSGRRQILREPPDCLLTTPESLELMLISPNVHENALFSNLQVVVIDEIHAFAGDDRGWHLLSVLERLGVIAGREIQRIGLSATVGNPETLIDWLAGSCQAPRDIYRPQEVSADDADVQLDFVGSLENAALVISRLHGGEKRLVFVDSRARAEQLAVLLRQSQIVTFVTHSSLSPKQRAQAEEAFATRRDCVIVATSVLELGIDVGNLDRVIQIDSPPNVSSFLQRMGRTGRRSGSSRNCLFLATKDEALIQAAALIDLWNENYVEPIDPLPLPYHVLAQQLLAITLQLGGVGKSTWLDHLGGHPAFSKMEQHDVDYLVSSMLERRLLWEESGILGVGQEAEEVFGRRNFMELLSVFVSAPLFVVLHGQSEVGCVEEMALVGRQDGPRVLLLGGRAWEINHIDWARRRVFVEPSDATGQTSWRGQGQGIGFTLSQAIRSVLSSDSTRPFWSNRARDRISDIREDYTWVENRSTAVIRITGQETEWWTFGGVRANAAIAQELESCLSQSVKHNAFSLVFDGTANMEEIENCINRLKSRDPDSLIPPVNIEAIDGLKFSECLPNDLAIRMLQERLKDVPAASHVLSQPVRYISLD